MDKKFAAPTNVEVTALVTAAERLLTVSSHLHIYLPYVPLIRLTL